MKIAIMQPYFFPYIAYWQLIKASDLYLIFDDVQYIKKGWINRNRILCDGKEKYIINPISHVSQNKLINQLEFVNDPKQLLDMEKTIAYAYRKSPHMDWALELVHSVLHNPQSNVADNLEYQIHLICGYLGIETKILRSSQCRGKVHPSSEEGIIDLAQSLSADCYLNPIGGTSLYHREKFNAAGLGLRFLKTDFDSICRMAHCEQMNYSIIDLIAKYPQDLLIEMMNKYELIM